MPTIANLLASTWRNLARFNRNSPSAKMENTELEHLIANSLERFYESRLTGLEKLSLRKVLSKKNPYLYRALGVEKASEIVEQIMAAYISSSDETIFGNCFFEPIAKLASGGKVGDGEG